MILNRMIKGVYYDENDFPLVRRKRLHTIELHQANSGNDRRGNCGI